MKIRKILLSVFLLFSPLLAQEIKQKTNAAAQANNPLANMTAFNIHNYYMGDLTQSDETANQAWLRYAKPFSVEETDWLLRVSLPINTFPVNPDGSSKTSIGDLNIFAAYLIDTGNPALSFGFGPQVTLPTAGDELLGSEKYSAGLVNVLFNASSKVFQYGYLLSWQHSFAGNSSRRDVNIAALQPFAMLQLGGGTYLRSVGICYYDIEQEKYSIPIGLGVGQIMKVDDTVFNLFIEPQYSVVDKGAGIAKWQIFTGLNMQFIGK